MGLWLDIFQWIHIVGGGVALITGLVAIMTKKGSRYHRLSGKLYFGGMSLVFITATVIGLVKWNPFLVLIGVFSYQLVVFGYRSLYHKQVHRQSVPRLDYALLIVALIGDLGLIGIGAWWLSVGNMMGVVALVFGLVGTLFVRNTYQKFNRPPSDKKHWLRAHLSGMLGGYIATVTAFLVVNIDFLPFYVTWFLPSVLGSILIAYYQRKHRAPY